MVEFHTQGSRMKCLQRESAVTGAIVPRTVVLCLVVQEWGVDVAYQPGNPGYQAA